MNTKTKIIGLGAVAMLGMMPAQAQLQISNGDFSLNPTQSKAPVDWFVPTTSGNWWESTWVGPNVSPNGTPVLGLSWMGSTPNWAYQNIGMNNIGATSFTLDFDIGSFTDSGETRNLGVTVSLYQSASFTAANGTDVNGAAGVALLGSQSVTSGPIPAHATTIVHETLTFDFSGANTTDPLYIRLVNFSTGTGQPWTAIDNITLTPVPEPSTMALCGLMSLGFLVRRQAKS
jgi:hypothetical protein